MPSRTALPLAGRSSCTKPCASARWSARLLSSSVIARARLARSPARIADARAPVSTAVGRPRGDVDGAAAISVEHGDGADPAAGRRFDLGWEARDGESGRGQLLQIGELLHLAIGDVDVCVVVLSVVRWFAGFGKSLCGVNERRVPAPGVDTDDTDASLGQIERGLTAHADAGRHVSVGAEHLARPGVDQDDVERLERVPDAPEFGFDLGGGDYMAVRQLAEIELDAGPEEPVERRFVDGHHRLALLVDRVEVLRRVHV